MIQIDNGRANEIVFRGTFHGSRKAKVPPVGGVFETLGVKTLTALPYNGKAKTIERLFRELADHEAGAFHKHRAYLGHKPEARPDDASGSVTLEEFSAFMEWAVDWWNDRPSDVLGGLSPKQAYARGLGPRQGRPRDSRRPPRTGDAPARAAVPERQGRASAEQGDVPAEKP